MQNGACILLDKDIWVTRPQRPQSEEITMAAKNSPVDIKEGTSHGDASEPNVIPSENQSGWFYHYRRVPTLNTSQIEISNRQCDDNKYPLGRLDGDYIVNMPNLTLDESGSAHSANSRLSSSNAVKIIGFILLKLLLSLPRKGLGIFVPFTKRKLICIFAFGTTATSIILGLVMYRLGRSVSEIAGVVTVVLALGTLYVMVAIAS